MGPARSPAALLDATVQLIEAGPDPMDQIEAGLFGLLDLLGADRGDAGFMTKESLSYRPARVAARGTASPSQFEVPASDPTVRAVLRASEPFLVADVRTGMATGPVQELLVRTGTRAIVVRRLDHLEDGGGMVCIDWVDRDADLPHEALELVDYFVARIWSPLLSRSVMGRRRAPGREPDPLASLSVAERAVARLAAQGRSYKEIAGARHTSINTVSQQLRAARQKVGARNTVELCSLIDT
jgi:DNA-binding CsgD family transcriptional regulator